MTRQFVSQMISLGLMSLLIPQTVYAQYKTTLEGEKRGSFTIGKCTVSSITAKYSISTSVGQPSIFLNIKWLNGGNGGASSINCLSNEQFDIFIKVNASGSEYFILSNGLIGLIPKGDNNWGYNPLAGSPNFDELFIKGTPYKNPNTNDWNYESEERSKNIWKNGFFVTAVILKEKAGSGQMYYIRN